MGEGRGDVGLSPYEILENENSMGTQTKLVSLYKTLCVRFLDRHPIYEGLPRKLYK